MPETPKRIPAQFRVLEKELAKAVQGWLDQAKAVNNGTRLGLPSVVCHYDKVQLPFQLRYLHFSGDGRLILIHLALFEGDRYVNVVLPSPVVTTQWVAYTWLPVLDENDKEAVMEREPGSYIPFSELLRVLEL